MRVAYLTTDEVNYHLACGTADTCGAIVEVVTFTELTVEGRFDVVLVDWDYLARERGFTILLGLFAGRRRCPLAVHGYHLEEDWQETLKGIGAAVQRRLDPAWLARWLRRMDPEARRQRLPNKAVIQSDGFPSNQVGISG